MIQERCEICEEPLEEGQEMAEMHEPKLHDHELYSEARAGVVHASCGTEAGWEIS